MSANARKRKQQSTHRGNRREQGALVAGVLAAALVLASPPAMAIGSHVGTLDVVSRADGGVLAVYPKDGRHWVVGTPGHEYTIRVCNTTGGRVLAVHQRRRRQRGHRRYRIARAVGLRAGARANAPTSTAGARAFRARPRSTSPSCPTRMRRGPDVPTTSASSVSRSSARSRKPIASRPPAGKIAARARRRTALAAGIGVRGRRPCRARKRRRRPTMPLARRRRPSRSSAPATAAARTSHAQVTRFDARARDAGRDDRDPLRPAREPGRDGHPAAADDRADAESVSRLAPRFVPDPPLADLAPRALPRVARPLAYSRAMPAPAIAHADADRCGDEDLMLAYAAGDAAAFDALYAAPQGRRLPLPRPPVRQRRRRRTSSSRTCG